MDQPRSRLPRAASNPTIRPLSTAALPQPRLPPPTRPGRSPTISRRQAGIPLRADSLRSRATTGSSISVSKPQPRPNAASSVLPDHQRLLPSRSTLDLSKTSHASPLGPKSTVVSAAHITSYSKNGPSHVTKAIPHEGDTRQITESTRARERVAVHRSASSVNLSTHGKPTQRQNDPTKSRNEDGGKSRRAMGCTDPIKALKSPFVHTPSQTPLSKPSLISDTPSVPRFSPFTMGSPTRPILSTLAQTPVLPRLFTAPWTNTNEPHTQIKDTELPFVEDDAEPGDLSGSPGYGQGTSRFHPPLPPPPPPPRRSPADSTSNPSRDTQHDRPNWQIGPDHARCRPLPAPGTAPPPHSPLGKAFSETSRELIKVREERDELRTQLNCRQKEVVHQAWGEVIRGTEAELENIKSFRETLAALKMQILNGE
ncbi:hypothetical protein IAR55_004535 [Kwoniella newhampshirensis]|uniref:Uncharacterized protein n=1 Tax=Kwoniella newhampshirensis TaxID=1651941 RepID=A0AAW0YPR0_9TREE